MRMTSAGKKFLVLNLSLLLILSMLQSSANAQTDRPDVYFSAAPLLLPSEDPEGFPELQAIAIVSSNVEIIAEVFVLLRAENTSYVFMPLADIMFKFSKGSNLILLNISYSNLLSTRFQNATKISVRFGLNTGFDYINSDYSNTVDLRDLVKKEPRLTITNQSIELIRNGLGNIQFMNLTATVTSTAHLSGVLIPMLAFEPITPSYLLKSYYFYAGGSGSFLPSLQMIDLSSPQNVSFIFNMEYIFKSWSDLWFLNLNETQYNISLYLAYASQYTFQNEWPEIDYGSWRNYRSPLFDYYEVSTWNFSEIHSMLNDSLVRILQAKLGSPTIVLYDDQATNRTYAFANVSLTAKEPVLVDIYTALQYKVEGSSNSQSNSLKSIYVGQNESIDLLVPLTFAPDVPKVYDIFFDLWISYSGLNPFHLLGGASLDPLNFSLHLNETTSILYATEAFGDFSNFQATIAPILDTGFNVSSSWLYSFNQQEVEIIEFQINITEPGPIHLFIERIWKDQDEGLKFDYPQTEYFFTSLTTGLRTVRIPYSSYYPFPSYLLSRMPGVQEMTIYLDKSYASPSPPTGAPEFSITNQTIVPPTNPLVADNLEVLGLNVSYSSDNGNHILSVSLEIENRLNSNIIALLQPLILSPPTRFGDEYQSQILRAFSTFSESKVFSITPGTNTIHVDFSMATFTFSANPNDRLSFKLGLELLTNLGTLFLSTVNNSLFRSPPSGTVSLVNNDNDEAIEGVVISLSTPIAVNPFEINTYGLIFGDFVVSLSNGFGLSSLSEIIFPFQTTYYPSIKLAYNVSYFVKTFSPWNSFNFWENQMVVSVMDYSILNFTWNRDILLDIGDTSPFSSSPSNENTNQSGIRLEPPRVNKLQASSYIDVPLTFMAFTVGLMLLVLSKKRAKLQL